MRGGSNQGRSTDGERGKRLQTGDVGAEEDREGAEERAGRANPPTAVGAAVAGGGADLRRGGGVAGRLPARGPQLAGLVSVGGPGGPPHVGAQGRPRLTE